MEINEKLLKPYNAKDTEARIYEGWEHSGLFNPDESIKQGFTESGAEPFSIVLPPPNVTGTLHTGHALMLAIEDTMVRYARMQGKDTLWIPGTDHAAIATQSKVEKELEKEGIKKRDLSREEFLAKVADFAKNSHDNITSQMKRMGASVDWSREAFTLDEKRHTAVNEVFKRMYNEGLIYRGDRIVNWDPKGQTVISDDELVYEEKKSKFYTFKYGPFEIATARPETKFGDKYVVMHPDDTRYQDYQHMQKISLEWINGPIEATVIKDEMIDMEFGTGVMTITPWHSHEDFALAEKYNLDKEQIIDNFGKLLPIAGEFAGMKITEAREKIVEKLKEKGLLVSVDENYTHRIATAERTGGIIEPQIMKQWFVDVNKKIPSRENKSLKELMLEAVEGGDVKIMPERFERVYYNWIENLRDWCISRQIWYGHRIPVYYKGSEISVGENPGEGWVQDEDTLDTWFSSGLWTFSTLGWPNTESMDFKKYHPTTVLETGYDIIFFWVARMILMSKYLIGTVPFKTVYMHGLVRDAKGRKMSKSLGNIVDPVDLIEKYGADALRMAMLVGVGPGNDNNLGEDKIKAYSKFANKIWNATRFVLEQTADAENFENIEFDEEDAKSHQELEKLIAEITTEMNEYKFYLVAEKLYHYFWHTFADILIERSKKKILENHNAESAKKLLRTHLETLISALHPFMPFITEELWAIMGKKDMLMVSKWPGKNEE